MPDYITDTGLAAVLHSGLDGAQDTTPSTLPGFRDKGHQQKNTLGQIRRRCVLMQATSLLRSLRPVRPEFRCNALYLLTRRRVVLTPWLHLSSGSLDTLLIMAPASHCLFRAP